MSLVNIPSTCNDPSYRYTMPRLVTKKEGRGNGKKTCIVNMGDVARAVNHRPEVTTKWFGYELGALSSYTNKEGEGERAIVNGFHDTSAFQASLDKFIEKYVLCEKCNLPEIDMVVKKGSIYGKCKACGWGGELDNVHKLAAYMMGYIIKNPPDAGGFCEESGTAKLDKKARQAARAQKSRKAKHSDDEDGDDDEESHAKEKKENNDEKGTSEKKEKKDKKEKKKKDEGGHDGDAPKKERKEKKAKGGGSGSGTGGEETVHKSEEDEAELAWDDERTQDVISTLTEFVKSAQEQPNVADFFDEIRMQQIAKVFDHRVRLYIGLKALFGGGMDAKRVVAKKAYLQKLVTSPNMKADDILWAFNVYLAAHPESPKGFAMVLKALYDEDFVDEASILAHYQSGDGDGPGHEAAKQAAAPFLQWLQTAESEADSDEE